MLRGIDLQVPEHEAVALIGASGSGKSTLLRCIDLLEEIDDGDVLLDGEVITDPSVDAGRRPPPARHRLPGLQPVPAPDACSTTSCSRRCARTASRRAEAEARARELLARFGLAGREHDYPDRLSGGQQQRVAIVRALATAAARAAARRGHERARPRAGRRGARGSSASSRPRG